MESIRSSQYIIHDPLELLNILSTSHISHESMSSRAQGDSPSRSVIRSTTIATACTTPSQKSQTLNRLNSVTRPKPYHWFYTHSRLTQPQRSTSQKETHSMNRPILPKIHNPANWTSDVDMSSLPHSSSDQKRRRQLAERIATTPLRVMAPRV